MNIQDAIKQASAGGKIKRKGQFGLAEEVEVCGPGRCMMMDIADIKADDWEVITPDIEVGDVVKGAHYACGIGEGKVLSIYLGKAHVESSHELVSLDRLTLIRKGAKKHVFKGVRWELENRESSILHPQLTTPSGEKPFGIINQYIHPNRIYTMTLEEDK